MSEVENKGAGEHYYTQVANSIKDVFQLTTRIDERVQSLIKKQDELERKMENTNSNGNSIASRVSVLESKSNVQGLSSDIEELKKTLHEMDKEMEHLKSETKRSGERYSKVVAFSLQIASACLIAYLLYKFHLKS